MSGFSCETNGAVCWKNGKRRRSVDGPVSVESVAAVGAGGPSWPRPGRCQRDLSQPNYESVVEGQMGRSPAYGSFAPNPNFPDGLTLRTSPAGTIARGQLPLHYDTDPAELPKEAVRAGRELRNPYPATDHRRQMRGGVVFTNFCEVCHGPFGQGDGPITLGGFPPPPSLLAERALQMPDGQMFHILTYGQGNMPAVAPQLSPEDRWCAILYVRQLQRSYHATSGKPVPVTLKVVKQLFNDNCMACHGADGTGSEMRKTFIPNIPDFTNLAWQVAQTEMAIVNQIDYGSAPLMPAFRYKLTREQIQGLAVYVRSFPSRQAGVHPATGYRPHRRRWPCTRTYCFACHDNTGQGDPLNAARRCRNFPTSRRPPGRKRAPTRNSPSRSWREKGSSCCR